MNSWKVHKFELPFHCHFACCFTQFGVATLMLMTSGQFVNQKPVAYPKKTHTTVFPNMAIFFENPHVFGNTCQHNSSKAFAL